MRECCTRPSNWRATKSLPDYLRDNNIVAIDGVDTRKITTTLRTKGALPLRHQHHRPRCGEPGQEGAGIAADGPAAITSKPSPSDETYEWNPGADGKYRVVTMDYGIKFNILRLLAAEGCRVIVMPRHHLARTMCLAQKPDGVFPV